MLILITYRQTLKLKDGEQKSSASRSTKSKYSKIKKLNTQHKDQQTKDKNKIPSKQPDACNQFSHLDPSETCAAAPLEIENLMFD